MDSLHHDGFFCLHHIVLPFTLSASWNENEAEGGLLRLDDPHC